MQYVEPAKQFAKDSIRLVKRCTKPDRKGSTVILVLLLHVCVVIFVDTQPWIDFQHISSVPDIKSATRMDSSKQNCFILEYHRQYHCNRLTTFFCKSAYWNAAMVKHFLQNKIHQHRTRQTFVLHATAFCSHFVVLDKNQNAYHLVLWSCCFVVLCLHINVTSFYLLCKLQSSRKLPWRLQLVLLLWDSLDFLWSWFIFQLTTSLCKYICRGWAKKTGLFLEVCKSRIICWHRIAFYISYCSVFYPE